MNHPKSMFQLSGVHFNGGWHSRVLEFQSFGFDVTPSEDQAALKPGEKQP